MYGAAAARVTFLAAAVVYLSGAHRFKFTEWLFRFLDLD
jgi:hypothetical protein